MSRSNDVQIMPRPPRRWWLHFGNEADGTARIVAGVVSLVVQAPTARAATEVVAKAFFSPFRALAGGSTYVVQITQGRDDVTRALTRFEVMHRERDGLPAQRMAELHVEFSP